MKTQILLLLCICLSISVLSLQDLPWVLPQDLNRGLPPSIQIYTLNTTSSPFGTKLTGAYAKFNMNDKNLEFIVRDTNGDALGYYPKTPMEYANAEQNVVYAVLNGGYFDMSKNISASYLAQGSRVKAQNVVNRGPNINPTAGAFGLTFQNKFQVEYIYSYKPNLVTYKFPIPNPFPGPAITPDQGSQWNVKEGIGAGPILIKRNTIVKGDVQNFGSGMIDVRHPRSAVCFDIFNNIYFVAIDGRYDGSQGLKMAQLAVIMQSIHCEEALNLDGGGSTLLYANNRIVNRPSDASGPRKVVSAILIRDRFKKKFEVMTS